MKKLGILLAALITATLVFSAIGCSSGGGGEGTGATTTPTHTVAATNTPATTLRPGASPTQTEAVSSDVLISFLPEPPSGWEAEKGVGWSSPSENCSSSRSVATRSYRNTATNEYAGVLIDDSGGCSDDTYLTFFQTALAEYQAIGKGPSKSLTFAGYPALQFNNADLSESLYVLVADRFVVQVSCQNDAITNAFASLIDYDAIAALK